MHCNGCGSDKALSVKTFTKKDEENQPILDAKGYYVLDEICNECNTMSLAPDYPRDAEGNKVIVTKPMRYSYAIDGPIHGARQLAEHLKRNNMVQKGK